MHLTERWGVQHGAGAGNTGERLCHETLCFPALLPTVLEETEVRFRVLEEKGLACVCAVWQHLWMPVEVTSKDEMVHLGETLQEKCERSLVYFRMENIVPEYILDWPPVGGLLSNSQ